MTEDEDVPVGNVQPRVPSNELPEVIRPAYARPAAVVLFLAITATEAVRVHHGEYEELLWWSISALMLWRGAWRPSVVIAADHFRIVNPLRTYTLRWDEITDLRRASFLVVYTVSGKQIICWAIGRSFFFDRFLVEVEARVRAQWYRSTTRHPEPGDR